MKHRVNRRPRSMSSDALRIAVLAAACTGSAARADSFTWNGNTGNFSDPTQWAGGVVPSGLNPADALTFTGSSAFTATNDLVVTPSAPAFYYSSLTLNSSVDGSFIMASNPTGFPGVTAFRSLGDATINQNGSGSFGVEMPISIPKGSTLTVNVANGAGQLTLANEFNGTTLAANSVFGEGTLVFNNQSSNAIMIGNLGGFGGNINILAGTVRVADSTSTPTRNSPAATAGGDTLRQQTLITIASGATFDINGNAEAMGGITGAGTFLLGPSGGINFGYTKDFSFAGTIASVGNGAVTKGAASGLTTYTFTGQSTYTGNTNLESGGLILAGQGQLANTAAVSVFVGATLTLDNSTVNLDNRINPNANFTLRGNLSLIGAPGQASSQTFNNFILTNATSGASINVVNGSGGGTATLTLDKLERTGRSAYVNFTGNGTVLVNNAPALINGILGGWAVINSSDFATTDTSGGPAKIVPFASYDTSNDPTQWNSGSNVKVTGPIVGGVAANISTGTINSLVLASTDHITVDGALTLSSGGIIATETTAIDGATTTSSIQASAGLNSPELFVTVAGGKTLTINTRLTNSPTNAFVKAGDGTLVFTNNMGQSGETKIVGGTLAYTSQAAFGGATNYRIAKGTLRIDFDGFTSNKTILFDNDKVAIDTNGHDVTFTGLFGASVGSDGTRSANGATMDKLGAGTLILANSATTFSGLYSSAGDLNIKQGGVRTGQGDTFGNATNIDLAPGTFLDLSYDQDGESLGSISGSGDVYMRAANGITYNNGSLDSITFSGRFMPQTSGTPSATGGTLAVQIAVGSLTLSGASTYTGATNVNSGTVVVGADALPDVPGPLGSSSTSVTVGVATAGDGSSAFLALASGVNMARNVVVNANASPSGTVKIGSVHTTGSSTFSGDITLNRGTELDVAAGGTTSLTGVVSGAGALVKVNGGTAVITGANTFAGGLVVDAGSVLLGQAGSSGTGPLRVNTGATLTAQAGMTGPIVTTGLALSGTGTFNLNDNDLIVDYTGASPLASIKASVVAARNGGAFNQPGLTSQSAAASNGTTTLAVVEATDLGLGTFGGVTLDGTDVIVKYTYYGDLNLDGKVNADDYVLADRGRAKGLSGWVNGDVNYDNAVNAADFALIDRSFALQGGVLDASFLASREAEFGADYVSALVASVPEPSICGLLVAGGLLARRRRNA